MERPTLIEPGVYHLLQDALQQSHAVRLRWYNRAVNLGSCILLLSILGLFLWSRYKGRFSPEEQAQRELHKQRQILEAFQHLQQAKRRVDAETATYGSISGLPAWEPEV